MAEEIMEAVQIIRVAYEGVEIAIRIGSGGLAAAQRVVETLCGMLSYEKTLGKTSMKKLLLKGGDLQVFQFRTEDVKKVEKMLKKYGILYSVLPDINPQDGMSEIIFHSEAVPRMNVLAKKLTQAKVTTFDDYLNNGTTEKVEPLLKFLKEQTQGNVLSHTEEGLQEGERAEELAQSYQELADRIQAVGKSYDTNLTDITISKDLIAEENDRAVKTRIPGTWGDNVRYLWTAKPQIMEIHDGKTLLTFLDTQKEYKLYDAANKVVEIRKGEELYLEHYDRVASGVRNYYEKVQREQSIPRSVSRKEPPQKRG